jgi:hypothetical protein
MMHTRLILILGTLLLCSCATPRPAATRPAVPIAPQPITTDIYGDTLAGPTLMKKVPGGYQLSNRLYRIVIDEQTGDVTFWGYVNEARNMIFRRGIYLRLTGLPDVSPQGYVEMRDEQTWQFFGEDANHIIWRKIYCLEGDSLFVSVLIQNNRALPLETSIQIDGDLIGLVISHHDPELFTGRGGYGGVTLQGFNELPSPASQPALPVLIQSDQFHLKPQERQGYTSRWAISQ